MFLAHAHFVFPAKFGVEPSGCVDLAKHVSINCPNLEFCGLMTIGMLDYTSTPENFKVLLLCTVQYMILLDSSNLLGLNLTFCHADFSEL